MDCTVSTTTILFEQGAKAEQLLVPAATQLAAVCKEETWLHMCGYSEVIIRVDLCMEYLEVVRHGSMCWAQAESGVWARHLLREGVPH